MGKIFNKINEWIGKIPPPQTTNSVLFDYLPSQLPTDIYSRETGKQNNDEVEVVNGYPPIWQKVINAGMKPDPYIVVVTYGKKIYIPSGKGLSDELWEHEKTHVIQQGDKPDEWWDKYLVDPKFRLDQETEAYAKQ